MRRVFASNLLLLLAINAIVKPLYLFGIDLGVQNTVGTEEYGLYATWFSFAFLFGTIYDLGLQNYNAVTLAKSPDLLRERLPLMLSLKLVLSLVYAAVVLAAAYFFDATPRELQLVSLAVAYHACLSILQLLRTNLGAQESYSFNSVVSVVDRLLLILVLGALLLNPAWNDWISIELFFSAQIATIILTIGVAISGTHLSKGQRWWSANATEVKNLLKASLPYGLTLLLSTAFTRIDVVMVEQMVEGTYAAGVYAASFRLLDGVNMIGFMFATLLIPMLSKLVEAREPAGPLLRQAAGYMAALGIGVAAFVTFYADEILELLYTDYTPEWSIVSQWLIWAAVGIALTYVYGSFLLSHQKIGALNRLFVAGVILNFALNFLLIPIYGALGAAIATVATQGLVAGGEWWMSNRLLKDEPGEGRWWPLPLYLVGCLLVGYTLHLFEVNLLVALIAQILACLALGLATGLLADIVSLLKKRATNT
ncbi:MAG: polysaccharide biosynthesis C-terminal domain-containing protein [Saprospiraceae bacterium]